MPGNAFETHRKAAMYLLRRSTALRRGTALTIAVAVLGTGTGPAISMAVRTDKSPRDTIPLKPAKVKPLDTPGTQFTTSTTADFATALNSGRHQFTHVLHLYPVTEPMPGAVTTPTVEYIEHLRFNDGAPTFVLERRQET